MYSYRGWTLIRYGNSPWSGPRKWSCSTRWRRAKSAVAMTRAWNGRGTLPRAGRGERGRGAFREGRRVHGDDGPGAAARARRRVDLRPHPALEDEGPRRELRARGDERGEAGPAARPAHRARVHDLSRHHA